MANKLNFIVDVDSKGAQTSFSKLKTGATGSASAMLAAFNPVTAALTAAAAAAVAIGVGLKKSISVASEFESSMANVSTLLDTTTVSMEDLKKQVLALPTALGSTDQLAKALYQVNSAGISGSDGIKVLTASAKVAKAGLTDTFTAVDAVTTIMADYNIAADDVGKATDQMFTTVRLGKTTFEELASSIGRVAPLAAQYGVTSEELFGSVAELTKYGSKSSEAMTALKATISNIIKPGKEAFETADALGIQFDAAALKAKGLSGVLADVAEKTKGNEEAMTKLFPSVEALNAVAKLGSEEGLAKLKESMDAIKNSGGATDTAFEKQTKTFKSAQEELFTAFEKLGITIGDKILPALTAMAKAMAEFIGHSETLATISNIIDGIANATKIWWEMWKLLYNVTLLLFPQLDLLIEGIKKILDLLPGFSASGATGEAVSGMEKFLKILQDTNAFLGNLRESVKGFLVELGGLKGKISGLNPFGNKGGLEYTDQEKAALDQFTDLKRKQEKQLANFIEMHNKAGTLTAEIITKYINQNGAMNKILSEGELNIIQFSEALASVAKKQHEVNIQFTGEGSTKLPISEKIKEVLGMLTGFTGEVDKDKPELNIDFKDGEGKPISRSLEIIKDGFSNFFGDVIKGTMSVEDGFKQMAASILQSIGDMLASQAVNGLVSLLGNSIGSLFGGTGADIPAMADGGIARGGKPVLVGERGPELFVPGQTGAVIPNGAGGGGINVINNITVNSSGGQGGDDRDNEKLGRQLGSMITEKVKEVLATEKRPGGMLNPPSAVGRA